MRRKIGRKTAARWAIAKLLISLLTFHWWVIPVVTSEEQSILLQANVFNTRVDTGFTPDQTSRNFLISPGEFRSVITIGGLDLEADNSAEFTVDLGSVHGIMTVYA